MKTTVRPIDRPELFYLHDDVIKASSPREVITTIEAMKIMGLYKLPYENIDIEATMMLCILMEAEYAGENPPLDEITYKGDFNKKRIRLCYRDGIFKEHFVTHDGRNYIEGEKDRNWSLKSVNAVNTIASHQKDLLVALLATKNVVKTKTENKKLKFGIGNKFTAYYTTTLTLPPNMYLNHEEGGTHKSPRPHLRRGHIKTQHFGPRNSFVKKIWVEPVFVNADDDFVSQRDHYNGIVRKDFKPFDLSRVIVLQRAFIKWNGTLAA